MKQKKQQSFSLIEAMIAISLFALVMTTLFGLLWHNSQMTKNLTKLSSEAKQLHKLHAHLQNVFTNFSHKTKNRDCFYIDDSSTAQKAGSLVFTFNNGIDQETYFSSKVLARLFVDQKQKLCLAIWPDPDKWKDPDTKRMRKEVLLENVTALDMQFWIPPDDNPPKPFKKEEMGVWLTNWKKEYKAAPAIIKITIRYTYNNEEKERTFCFVHPTALQEVIYKG